MNIYKRIVTVILIALCMTISTGCSVGNLHIYFSSTSGIGDVFKIKDLECPKKEFKVYLCNYKNLYGSYDDDKVLSADNETSIVDGLKSAVLDHLTRVYSLNLYAEDNDIELSADEENDCKKAAEEYYSTLTSNDKSYMNVSESDIYNMYKRYVLSWKVYNLLMDSVDEEVSLDEARIMEAEVIYVNNKADLDAVSKSLNNGTSFTAVAQQYSKTDYIDTFGRGKYPEAVDKVVFNMENGQVSNPITTDDGYYIFKCINKYNRELSEANKSLVIKDRKERLVDDIVSSQEEKYYSHISESALDSITISEKDEVQSDSFFEVINKYIGFN